MKAKSESEVAQSCPTPSDPTDCSPPGSSIHGIFQARALEWVPLPSPCDIASEPSLKSSIILLPILVAAAAKLLQSCLTLCDPIDGLLPGFPVPGILQVRTLEWLAISFSNA